MKLLAIREWQHQWDMETRGRHLYAIQSKVEAVKNRGGNRKKEIVMTRLRISHSNLNSTLHIIGKHITVFFLCLWSGCRNYKACVFELQTK